MKMESAPSLLAADFSQLKDQIQLIKNADYLHLDVMDGVSLNPATPIETLKYLLPELDQVLIMSVNPGFGGQSYIPQITDKIAKLNKIIEVNNYDCKIEDPGAPLAEMRGM